MGHRDDVHYETLDYQTYDPHHLVDSILDHLELDTDAAFARELDVPPSVIDEIRFMKRPIDAAMLLRMHELSGLSVPTLRNILGDRRKKIRFDDT
jgi:hypothetical protein